MHRTIGRHAHGRTVLRAWQQFQEYACHGMQCQNRLPTDTVPTNAAAWIARDCCAADNTMRSGAGLLPLLRTA